MSQPLHVIILAAGQGTRMKSALPKVLHPVGGKPMLGHVLEAAAAIGAKRSHVVHGHGAEQVRQWFAAAHPDDQQTKWVLQAEQLGTAHAVLQAMPGVPDEALVMVLYGDTPLISPETLQQMVTAAGAKNLALLTVELADPKGYGRILRDRAGAVTGIVEENDANERQKRITEVNTGVIAAPAKRLRSWLEQVGNDNAKREFYLTDVIALAVRDKIKVQNVSANNAAEVEGVNDRLQLARIERVFQRRQADALMRAGLHLVDPARFELRGSLHHGRDCSIDVGVIIEGWVDLADGVRIGPYCVLKNVKLGPGTVVEAHCVLEGLGTGADAQIGPFARVRPGTAMADGAKIGNFVEAKNAQLGRGAKVNHLTYVGDAELGTDVNVGAGTITCNYDGANKHRTVIGDGAFIGSNSSLVAPVTIGAGATIGAGSTITQDAPAGELTIARGKQQTIAGWKRPVKTKK